jgi:hypothetical protein
MGEFDGAYNWKKGGWNPSPDSHRYDSSNSLTGMDFALGGMGIRRWGMGAKPPFWARAGNKHAELTVKGAKGLYRGATKVRTWKRIAESKISKKIAKDTRLTPYGRNQKQVTTDILKKVARIANSKKGRALITAGSLWGLGQVGEQTKTSNEDSWVVRKKKKKGAFFR